MSLRLSLWLGVPLLLVGLRAWRAGETQHNTWASLGAGGFFLASWFFFERESDKSEEEARQGASGAGPGSTSIKQGSLSTPRSRRSRPQSQPKAAQATSMPASCGLRDESAVELTSPSGVGISLGRRRRLRLTRSRAGQ